MLPLGQITFFGSKNAPIPARGILSSGICSSFEFIHREVMSFFVAANCYLRQSWQSVLSLAIEGAGNRDTDAASVLAAQSLSLNTEECHKQLLIQSSSSHRHIHKSQSLSSSTQSSTHKSLIYSSKKLLSRNTVTDQISMNGNQDFKCPILISQPHCQQRCACCLHRPSRIQCSTLQL